MARQLLVEALEERRWGGTCQSEWWARRHFNTGAGVRVVVHMRRVAVGRSAGAYTQAVGIRSRREWCRRTISRRELVGITGRLAHADGQQEVLVVGELEEVWEEWTGQAVEGTNREPSNSVAHE